MPHSDKKMSIHYQSGKMDKVAFVFSCPGRFEEEAGHPVAKTTGTNLNKLLVMLSKVLSRDDLLRENITISNCWDRVEYNKLTKRSEATDWEIQAPKNIHRLAKEIAHITDFIVFCGAKAKLASNEITRSNLLNNNPRFLYLRHLGTRGLLSISKDIDGNLIKPADVQIKDGRKDSRQKIQSENTKKRIMVVANSLGDQLRIPLVIDNTLLSE